MSYSPTFRHSVESFQHGLEHYLEGTPLSRKFAFLHIDHAIELLLKEKLKQLGESIYKSNNETLNLHEVIKSLERKNVPVCEKPRVEDLHGIRNLIQHTGHTPDEDETRYYLEIGYTFYKNFLKEHMQDSLSNHIGMHYIRLMEGTSGEEEKIDQTIIKIEKNLSADPANAILISSRLIEHLLNIYRRKKGIKPFRPMLFIDMMYKEKLITKQEQDNFKLLWAVRNRTVHTLDSPSTKDAKEFWSMAKPIIENLLKILKDCPVWFEKEHE